ncbi:GvpL/GvpF family gas vesicle protein [Amycolatopsis sp. 195334CR]|uniref:GvpL/GvpF family gas vesicle protein n=1 Tax=Amycolatopsis sp. 195334CR TaxID=2814588 RepID=UPI001A8EDCD6|nr:GvpL/GvpF family gas vesicle protein [Amycolatopsis sp. 195334CR]MBN6038976.1 GvpL/GvpF family gas vesicle protein [Amycolatopsis sp. 195334CR]
MTLNLHGVVRAGHPTDRRLVVRAELAVVVTEAEPDALRHLEILSGLVPHGPVVPLRFGTTAVDEEVVRTEVLARSAHSLRGHLDRLDGVAELHAYLRFDEDTALRAVHEENPGLRLGDGPDLAARIRAGERIAHLLVAWRRARADTLLAPVSALARAEAPLPDAEPTEDRRAFLVPLAKIEAARKLVTAIDGDCVAPLPAFTFLAEPTAPASRWGW